LANANWKFFAWWLRVIATRRLPRRSVWRNGLLKHIWIISLINSASIHARRQSRWRFTMAFCQLTWVWGRTTDLAEEAPNGLKTYVPTTYVSFRLSRHGPPQPTYAATCPGCESRHEL